MNFYSYIKKLLERNKGVYVGTLFDNESERLINDFIVDNNIPNPNTDLHCTLIYSRKYADFPVSKNVLIDCYIKELVIFNNDTNCLVAVLESDYLKERHKELMKRHDLTYDYDEYIPHIALSYDVPDDFDISKIEIPKWNIKIQSEYREDLDLKWGEK